MKYTTKELFEKPQEEIDSICGGRCGTDRCLFKKSLWKYRFDGYCLKDTIEIAKNDIINLESDILYAEKRINDYKSKIKFDKKRIKAFEKELENDK